MTKVKICGLSTPEAVQTAVEAGADYIGFVLAPSRRQVSLRQARDLSQLIPSNIAKVGVFVNPTTADVLDAIETIGLDVVQIHGLTESSSLDLDSLPVPVIMAIQVDKLSQPYHQTMDYLLFDALIAGSGQTFDWSVLDISNLSTPVFIAGGLTEENVFLAIERFRPYAVDVSSGVETNGQKDSKKIRNFIQVVKGEKHDIPRT